APLTPERGLGQQGGIRFRAAAGIHSVAGREVCPGARVAERMRPRRLVRADEREQVLIRVGEVVRYVFHLHLLVPYPQREAAPGADPGLGAPRSLFLHDMAVAVQPEA